MLGDFDIRADAATIKDDAATGGLESYAKAIGHPVRVAIVAPVAIVYGLDAAAAWDIVFGCGDFELAI